MQGEGGAPRVDPVVPTPQPESFEELQERLQNESNALTAALQEQSIAAQFALFEAQQGAEAERRAAAASLIREINRRFNGRDAIYENLSDLTYQANVDDLNNQQEDARLRTKHGLARNGLAGGSVDSDLFRKIAEQQDKGLIQARNFADQTGNDLRAQDQSLKSNLTGLASTGQVDGSILGGLSSSLDNTANLSQTPVVNPNQSNQFAGIAEALGQGLYQIGQQQQYNRARVGNSPGKSYGGTVS